jgi:hypothetical protein
MNFKFNQDDPLLEGTISVEQYKDLPLLFLFFRNKALQIKQVRLLFKNLSKSKISGSNNDVLILQVFKLPKEF